MENASKALIMAGSILVGMLILALMLTLFASSKELTAEYEQTKQSEAVQQFNANFTQYVGQDITIHDVITICNFAKQNGFESSDITTTTDFEINTAQISTDINDANIKLEEEKLKPANAGKKIKVEVVYKMQITGYNDQGYVSKISFLIRDCKITIF